MNESNNWNFNLHHQNLIVICLPERLLVCWQQQGAAYDYCWLYAWCSVKQAVYILTINRWRWRQCYEATDGPMKCRIHCAYFPVRICDHHLHHAINIWLNYRPLNEGNQVIWFYYRLWINKRYPRDVTDSNHGPLRIGTIRTVNVEPTTNTAFFFQNKYLDQFVQ